MKEQRTVQAHQLEKFALFLEKHPAFSPLLMGGDALVFGFLVDGAFLRIEEMERLVDTQPRFDAQEAALLGDRRRYLRHD